MHPPTIAAPDELAHARRPECVRVRLAHATRVVIAAAIGAIGAMVCATALVAQAPTDLPVVRATSKVADLREGDVPNDVDVGRGKRVAIITDVDSIAFDVTPGSTFDFVVLVGRDSAFSRVTAVNPHRPRLERSAAADTIPFRLGRGNKMYLRARVNGSETLTLMFDTGADMVVLSTSGMRAAKVAISGEQGNAGFGGGTTVRRSEGNVLEVAGLRWRDLPIIVIDRADADGILGYEPFEDKVVAIDHGRGTLVVSDSLPALTNGWSGHEIRWEGNLPFIRAAIVQGGVAHEGWFEFDTGASWGMFVESHFVRAARLAEGAERLAVRTSRGVGPNAIETDLVRVAALRIGPHQLTAVPVDLERPSAEQRRGDGIFGMDVLRRFDVVIDYPNSRLYLRPNAMAGAPYAATSRPWGAILGLALATLAVVAGVAWWLARRRAARTSPATG